MTAAATGTPVPRTVTQRRQLAQNVRHLLDDYRYAKAMSWPDGQREGNLRLALAGILRLMELEGMPGLDQAVAKVDDEAKARLEGRRCATCGQDPRYTPPDYPCDHEPRESATGGGLPDTPGIR